MGRMAAEAARRNYGGRSSWSNGLHGGAWRALIADLIDGRNLIAIMFSALNAAVRICGSVQSARDFDKRAASLRTQYSILLEIGLGIPRPRQFHCAQTHRCSKAGRNLGRERVHGRDVFRAGYFALYLATHALDRILIGLAIFRADVDVRRLCRGG